MLGTESLASTGGELNTEEIYPELKLIIHIRPWYFMYRGAKDLIGIKHAMQALWVILRSLIFDHSWFRPIDSDSQHEEDPQNISISSSLASSFDTPTPANIAHTLSKRIAYSGNISPCSDSNQSSVSTTSACMYGQQQRSVTPASSHCSSNTGTGGAGGPFSGIGTAAYAVPSNIPYQGQYGFQIGFDAQTKDTKAVMWTYSPALRKLFVRMANNCPIKFRTSMPTPPGTIIKATPIYVRSEHVQDIVHRCPNHATGKEYNDNHPAPAHLLRCDHSKSQYCEDHVTGRHSVVIPSEQPQPGSEWVTNLYQFMCFSSCVGGLNRRPIQVIFTLENKGHILGRQSVEVRICACPGRDKKVEENAMFPKPKPVKRPLNLNNGNFGPAPKKVKLNGVDTEEFTMIIRGRENFEILSKIRNAMELAFLLPQDTLQQMQGRFPNTPNTVLTKLQ